MSNCPAFPCLFVAVEHGVKLDVQQEIDQSMTINSQLRGSASSHPSFDGQKVKYNQIGPVTGVNLPKSLLNVGFLAKNGFDWKKWTKPSIFPWNATTTTFHSDGYFCCLDYGTEQYNVAFILEPAKTLCISVMQQSIHSTVYFLKPTPLPLPTNSLTGLEAGQSFADRQARTYQKENIFR